MVLLSLLRMTRFSMGTVENYEPHPGQEVVVQQNVINKVGLLNPAAELLGMYRVPARW
jgi:hypothetical protein